jgi:hydrogenase maturation protease
MAERLTVLGVGNLLFADEGVGVHAVRLLARRHAEDMPGVEFLDGGTLGLNLLRYIEESNALLLLDAVDIGAAPGTVTAIAGEDLPRFAGIKLSEHQVTVQEVLGLARIRGRLPERLALVGMQPASLAPDDLLSPVAAAALPEMLERAEGVLDQWAKQPLLFPPPTREFRRTGAGGGEGGER